MDGGTLLSLYYCMYIINSPEYKCNFLTHMYDQDFLYRISDLTGIANKWYQGGRWVQTDQILSDCIRICIQIISDTDIFEYEYGYRYFLSDTNMDTVFNLEPDTDTNTDNYPDPDIFEIRIS
jgi:hypothetical protein